MHRGKFTDNSVDTLPNDASRDQVGGALNLVTFSAATIKMSVFQRNVAQKGGALYVQVSFKSAQGFWLLLLVLFLILATLSHNGVHLILIHPPGTLTVHCCATMHCNKGELCLRFELLRIVFSRSETILDS